MLTFGQNLWEKNWSIWENLAKSGQSLEKVSQPSGLRFHLNKYDFLKLE
jgi:hypothetical protein